MSAPASSRLRALRFPPALRHREFRRFWSGLLLSVLGFQILTVVHAWLIYDITNSARYLAFLGLVTAVPTIALNLFGGVVADRFDQRKLLIATQGASALLIAVLATLVALGASSVAHVLVIAALSASVLAFDTPSRQSLYPHLIDRADLMNAVALNASVWQGTRIVGPALGGVLIATMGAATGYYAASLGFVVMVALRSDVNSGHQTFHAAGSPA